MTIVIAGPGLVIHHVYPGDDLALQVLVLCVNVRIDDGDHRISSAVAVLKALAVAGHAEVIAQVVTPVQRVALSMVVYTRSSAPIDSTSAKNWSFWICSRVRRAAKPYRAWR